VGASSRDLRAAAEAEVPADGLVAPLDADSSLGEAMAHPVIGPTVTGMLKGAGLSADVMVMTRAMPLGRLVYQPGSGVTHQQVQQLLDVANGTGGVVTRATGRLLTLARRLHKHR
jgi:beta-glucosidase